MHAAALLTSDSWRSAGSARAGPGPATMARKHWPGIARMITFHFFNVRDAGTGACFLLETILGIGAVLASVSCGGEAAALSGAAARWRR